MAKDKEKKGFEVSDRKKSPNPASLRGLENLKKSSKKKPKKPKLNIPEEYDEEEEEKKEHEEKEKSDEELKRIREEFKSLKKKADAPRFPRIESKPEFASEVVNVPSNQKVANLKEWQISDLLRKRKFMNMCNEYGWGVVAKMAGMTIADIENYSLSKKGFLIDNVLNERQKQTVYSEQYSNKKKSKRRSEK